MAVLRESFALILVLFVNVLVITCWRIDASSPEYVDVEEFINEDFENESPDGTLYNLRRTEKGPIRADIFDARTDLSFLGTINLKHFYIIRTVGTYAQALANCSTMGMTMGQPTNQAEINFLFGATVAADNNAWVGAFIPTELRSFRWEDSNTSPPASVAFSILSTAPNLALTLIRNGATNSGFQARHKTGIQRYFCMLDMN